MEKNRLDDQELKQVAGGWLYDPPARYCPECKGNVQLTLKSQFGLNIKGSYYKCPKCGYEVSYLYHFDTEEWTLYPEGPW